MKKILSIILVVFFFISIAHVVFAEVDSKCADTGDIDEIINCISQYNDILIKSKTATAPLISQVNGMKNRLATIESSLITKKKNIDDGYANLAKQQKQLNNAIRDYYIKSYYNSPLAILLSTDSASDITQILTYQKKITDQDKLIITNMALTIQGLQKQRENLQTEQISLASAKVSLDKVISQATTYQATISTQIAALSAKQQQILSQRISNLNIPLYAYSTQGGCSSDLKNGKDPGFSGGFGFFTYGVPNRVGLNQYGAWGRAKAGQDSDAILHAYYNFDGYQNMDTTIRVNDSNGYDSGNIIWTGSLEDYMKRIWEVPDSWADNNLAALKAQAIAARSYVMAQTNNGAKSICSNTHCQVFQTNPKGGNWEAAVNATPNQIMVQGGQPITAYFSSTHGGYVYTSGGDISSRPWLKSAKDTNGDVSSFADLNNNAYDKDSNWFYCDWGGRSQYGGTAWMKPDEVADIVNTLLLTKADSGTKEHLYQTDKPNPAGTDNWDANRVKQELRNKGITPLDSVSSASVGVDFGSGITNSININGQSFSGSEFKDRFNLRAPANINIVGPLYNVERK